MYEANTCRRVSLFGFETNHKNCPNFNCKNWMWFRVGCLADFIFFSVNCSGCAMRNRSLVSTKSTWNTQHVWIKSFHAHVSVVHIWNDEGKIECGICDSVRNASFFWKSKSRNCKLNFSLKVYELFGFSWT